MLVRYWNFITACFRKSTIVKLLFRFFDPDEGRVLINGQNIKDLDLHSVRKVIGVVPQVNSSENINYSLKKKILFAYLENVHNLAVKH